MTSSTAIAPAYHARPRQLRRPMNQTVPSAGWSLSIVASASEIGADPLDSEGSAPGAA